MKIFYCNDVTLCHDSYLYCNEALCNFSYLLLSAICGSKNRTQFLKITILKWTETHTHFGDKREFGANFRSPGHSNTLDEAAKIVSVHFYVV